MQFWIKSMLLLSVLLNDACTAIPRAPKFDLGVMRVRELSPGRYSAEALFKNEKGTEYKIQAAKLDKYLVVNPQQALDLMAWMNKVMTVLKAELYRK